MIKSEEEIRMKIDNLKSLLKQNEACYSIAHPLDRSKLLMDTFNIESQLQALYYVLGESYTPKHYPT